MPKRANSSPKQHQFVIDDETHSFWIVQNSPYSWRAYGDYGERNIDVNGTNEAEVYKAWVAVARGH